MFDPQYLRPLSKNGNEEIGSALANSLLLFAYVLGLYYFMPTGYTAGILDGTTKDFKQFATNCMRAFGATIHMRDDSADTPYKPDEVTSYHSDAIAKAKGEIAALNKMDNAQIEKDETKVLNKNLRYHKSAITKIRKQRSKLGSLLADALVYEAPTTEHNGIKSFMENQLTETIKHDCSESYHRENIEAINTRLSSIDPQKVWNERMDRAKKDLAYHTAELEKETERVTTRNKWVVDYLASINP